MVVVHFKFRIKLFDEADNNIFWAGIQTFWYAAKLQGIFCMYTAQANQVNTTGFVFLILQCVFLVLLSTSFIFSSSSVSIVSISDVWFFRRFLKVFFIYYLITLPVTLAEHHNSSVPTTVCPSFYPPNPDNKGS